jgi:hypothetical protein
VCDSRGRFEIIGLLFVEAAAREIALARKRFAGWWGSYSR